MSVNGRTESGLGGKTVRGGVFTVLMQVSSTGFNLLGLMVLARLIAPSDFGLIAKVSAITGIVALIGDLGLSIATIQRKEITHAQLSSLFWVNVLVSLAVASLIAGASPLIALFYQDDRVILVAIGLGINAAVAGVGVQHLALLKRGMKFATIAAIQVSAVVFGVISAIIAAWLLDWGYWALVVQLIAATVFKTVGCWIKSGFVPTRKIQTTGVWEELKMGGNFTTFQFVNFFARNGDNVLIAKVWGEQAVGFYAKAYGLLLLPMKQLVGPMSQVAVPALSRLQNKPEEYRAFFRKGVSIAMVLQVPLTVFTAVAGAEIVLTVLGPDWEDSIPIFYALVPNLLASSTSSATQWVFISRGDTRRLLKIGVFNAVCILASFLVGLPYGAVGVAWAFSITSCVIRVPSILYCFKPAPVTWRDFFPFMVAPALCSLVAGVASLAAAFPFEGAAPWALLILKVGVFGLVYAITILVTEAGKDVYSRLWGQVVRMRGAVA